MFDKVLNPTVTFTPDAAAYSAGDSIGGALTFDVSDSATGMGVINNLLVADNEGIGAAGALWLFKQDLATPIADNAAFAVAFADLANLITVLTLPAYVTISTFKEALLEDINTVFEVSGGKIIGYFVPSGAPDWAASKSIHIHLGILTQ